MTKLQIIFLLLAFLTTMAIIGIGISISLGSLLVFSLSVVTAAICCGVGFSLRKRNANQN